MPRIVMLRKEDVVGRSITAVLVSENPERVNPYDLPDDSLFYRWYVELENGVRFCLHPEGVEKVKHLDEPVRQPRINYTRWVPSKERYSRGIWTSEELREAYIRASPFVRTYTYLNETDSAPLVVGKQVTAVLVCSRFGFDRHVSLVLSACSHLGVWSSHDGNVLQFDALDERLDSKQDSNETWHCLFDATPCDLFGRPLSP